MTAPGLKRISHGRRLESNTERIRELERRVDSHSRDLEELARVLAKAIARAEQLEALSGRPQAHGTLEIDAPGPLGRLVARWRRWRRRSRSR